MHAAITSGSSRSEQIFHGLVPHQFGEPFLATTATHCSGKTSARLPFCAEQGSLAAYVDIEAARRPLV